MQCLFGREKESEGSIISKEDIRIMVDCIVRVQSRDGISTIPVSSYLHEMVSTLGLYSRVCIHVAKKTEKMYQRALPLLRIVKFGGVAIWRVSCCRRKSLSRILPSLRFTTHANNTKENDDNINTLAYPTPPNALLHPLDPCEKPPRERFIACCIPRDT